MVDFQLQVVSLLLYIEYVGVFEQFVKLVELLLLHVLNLKLQVIEEPDNLSSYLVLEVEVLALKSRFSREQQLSELVVHI